MKRHCISVLLSLFLFILTSSQVENNESPDIYQLEHIEQISKTSEQLPARPEIKESSDEYQLEKIESINKGNEEKDEKFGRLDEYFKEQRQAKRDAVIYDNTQVEALQNFLREQDEKIMQALEDSELTKTLKAAVRYEIVEKFKKSIATKPIAGNKVAILGQSSVEFSEVGFNPDILATLFQLIKAQEPKAVFFTGNFVYSLVNPSSVKSHENEKLVDIPPEKNIFGQVVEKESGIYNGQDFKNALERFSRVLKENLGSDIPFYPLVGTQESLGADALDIFRKQFGLKDATVLDSGQLVYTVPIGSALFVVISTNYYANGEPVESNLSPPIWEWLDNSIKTEGEKYPFLFVIGSDPAYSTTGPFGIYNGLDRNQEERDKFWSILMEHQVLAYFCGKEVLYDRSHRYGVWQIISGGAGTPHNYSNIIDDTFYHYVLLTIPNKQTQDSKIEVYDHVGHKKDEVVISKKPSFLYEFRISKS